MLKGPGQVVAAVDIASACGGVFIRQKRGLTCYVWAGRWILGVSGNKLLRVHALVCGVCDRKWPKSGSGCAAQFPHWDECFGSAQRREGNYEHIWTVREWRPRVSFAFRGVRMAIEHRGGLCGSASNARLQSFSSFHSVYFMRRRQDEHHPGDFAYGATDCELAHGGFSLLLQQHGLAPAF